MNENVRALKDALENLIHKRAYQEGFFVKYSENFELKSTFMHLTWQRVEFKIRMRYTIKKNHTHTHTHRLRALFAIDDVNR